MKAGIKQIRRQKYSFPHGVHIEDFKYLTNQSPIERMPFQEEYVLPLSQHIGSPSIPIIRKGQSVKRGQMIAEADGQISVALHSPVDGIIEAIGLFEHPNGKMLPAIKIKTELFSIQSWGGTPAPELKTLDTKGFINAVQHAGLVGMGGAAFPAHRKFIIPENKHCRYLMINGCECEPFLTSDHRMMMEYAEELMDGVAILQQFIKAEKVFIGIEDNKQDAIDLLRNKSKSSGEDIEIVAFRTKYPQGSEKMMISAILNKEVPSGAFPLELETLVSNVGTVIALSNYFRKSQPLVERVVTVSGTAIRRPSNLLVPIGTSMKKVVDYCGGITEEASHILLGGPLMGVVQKSLDVPVLKATSGILVLTGNEVRDIKTYSCIRCGKCLEVCPIFLNPSILGLLSRKGLWDDMEKEHVLDCFECAACSYICPSGIPLVQSFRIAKGIIREKHIRERNKEL